MGGEIHPGCQLQFCQPDHAPSPQNAPRSGDFVKAFVLKKNKKKRKKGLSQERERENQKGQGRLVVAGGGGGGGRGGSSRESGKSMATAESQLYRVNTSHLRFACRGRKGGVPRLESTQTQHPQHNKDKLNKEISERGEGRWEVGWRVPVIK